MKKRRIVRRLADPGSILLEASVDGVARVLDLSGAVEPLDTDARDDADALRSDWSAVATDMYSAIEQASS